MDVGVSFPLVSAFTRLLLINSSALRVLIDWLSSLCARSIVSYAAHLLDMSLRDCKVGRALRVHRKDAGPRVSVGKRKERAMFRHGCCWTAFADASQGPEHRGNWSEEKHVTNTYTILRAISPDDEVTPAAARWALIDGQTTIFFEQNPIALYCRLTVLLTCTSVPLHKRL